MAESGRCRTCNCLGVAPGNDIFDLVVCSWGRVRTLPPLEETTNFPPTHAPRGRRPRRTAIPKTSAGDPSETQSNPGGFRRHSHLSVDREVFIKTPSLYGGGDSLYSVCVGYHRSRRIESGERNPIATTRETQFPEPKNWKRRESCARL